MTGPRGRRWQIETAAAFPGGWDELVDSDPAADYSQTRHWTEAACRHYPDARPLCLSIRRGGELVAGLCAVARPGPRRVAGPLGVVRRFDSSLEGTAGGPVLSPQLDQAEAEQVFGLLVEHLAQQRRGLLAVVAVALNPAREARFGRLMPRPDWTRFDSPTAMVSLAGGLPEVEKSRLVMNKRNERNRGLKRGAEVFATEDPELLEQYYPLYRRATAHWGVPPTPLGFLRDLLTGRTGAGSAGGVFLTCVRLDRKVIGGHLCLHLHDRVLAWNGVTDPDFARSHFPATLCFWGDMVEADRRGARWLDLGASGALSTLESFKKSFGAELKERGFYVRESRSLSLIRRMRAGLKGSGGVGERWHDRQRSAAAKAQGEGR